MIDLIWLNGKIFSASEARINPADRGFLLGDGVFDTMLVDQGKMVEAEAHFARLARHATVLDLPCPPSAYLQKAATDLIRMTGPDDRCALRTTLTRGSGPRGLMPPVAPEPTLMMRLSPSALPGPARVITAKTVRRNGLSPLSRIKSLNYGDQMLARMEGARLGADDALLFNQRDQLCCASAANIIVLIDGGLYTPPLSDGVLDGITRQKLLGRGDVDQRSLSEADLAACDALWLVNSLGIRAVREIDGRTLAVDSSSL